MISLYFDNFKGGGGKRLVCPPPLNLPLIITNDTIVSRVKRVLNNGKKQSGLVFKKLKAINYIYFWRRFRFIVEECGCRKGQGYKLNKPLFKFCICNYVSCFTKRESVARGYIAYVCNIDL